MKTHRQGAFAVAEVLPRRLPGYLDSLSDEITNKKMHTAVQSLDWGQLYQGGGIDPVLAEGMFAAQAAGTCGMFAAEPIATELFQAKLRGQSYYVNK